MSRHEESRGEENARVGAALFLEEFPCAYFEDGRIAVIEYLFADGKNRRAFHRFLAKGYRRLGSVFYRSVCVHCSACLPIRIETGRFEASKSQRRTLKRNMDVRLDISPVAVTGEKIELYEKYLSEKHGEKENEEVGAYKTLLSLHFSYPSTIEMDYYLGDRLIGVGIVDEAADSLSSNYFYYDTDHLDRRLGVFSIVSEISLARFLGKKYYYLGFYIEGTRKMSYKKYFRPNQIYENGGWRDFSRPSR